MSNRADPAQAAPESFALARHGLPLSGALPSLPRAAWLPAAVRGSSFGLPAAVGVEPAADDTDEDEIDLDGDAMVSVTGRSERAAFDDPHLAKPSQGVGPASSSPGGGRGPALPSAADLHSLAGAGSSLATALTAAGATPLPAVHRNSHGTGGENTEPGGPGERPLADALQPPAPRPVQAAAGLNPAQSLARQQAGLQRHDEPLQRAPSSRGAEAASAAHGEPALPMQAAVQQHPLAPPPTVTPSASATAAAPSALPMADARAVRAVPESRRAAEPRTTIVMGLPDAPATAMRGPAAPASPAMPDLAGLLAPPAAATRTVRIDRVQVSLQTAPQPPTGASVAAAPPLLRGAAPTGARAYRSPWVSNHARRD